MEFFYALGTLIQALQDGKLQSIKITKENGELQLHVIPIKPIEFINVTIKINNDWNFINN